MLYYLFQYLEKTYHISGARLFQYTTFRAGMALILSLIISLILGRQIIEFLRSAQIGEVIRNLGLEGEKQKKGTPTMGGVIIILAILIPTLLFARLDNVYIILMFVTTSLMAAIGFLDDYIKVFLKNKEGLAGRFKVLGQVILGLIVALTMLYNKNIVVRMDAAEAEKSGLTVVKTVYETGLKGDQLDVRKLAHVKTLQTNIPFVKGNDWDYSKLVQNQPITYILFTLWVIFLVTAISNAANLTDGIDGLATGVSAIVGIPLAIFAYVSGNTMMADYLNVLYIPYTEELFVFGACFVGACIGFLWYNTYPAQVFMGDTGSLTLGGIIAVMAILLRKELLLPVLCGVFLVENLSVVLQVSYFKYTKKKYGEGKRIFLMSPLHHHFQKEGKHEAKIVTRFWIVSIMLAVLSIITLKIR
jgi:phospho-N-acetylmuramoyl-pentapeptide-transferase